ncbi:MAG: hypothetical protein ABI947_20155 [Chloroflexota bacterium]
MLIRFINHLKGIVQCVVRVVSERLVKWIEPRKETLVGGVIGDMLVSKRELIAENALLRQQVIVLQRQVKRPRLKDRDRLLLVLLASRVRAWRQALLLVKPETLLGWHRQMFRLVWKRKTKTLTHQSRVPAETIALIKQMAHENRLWGRAGYKVRPWAYFGCSCHSSVDMMKASQNRKNANGLGGIQCG